MRRRALPHGVARHRNATQLTTSGVRKTFKIFCITSSIGRLKRTYGQFTLPDMTEVTRTRPSNCYRVGWCVLAIGVQRVTVRRVRIGHFPMLIFTRYSLCDGRIGTKSDWEVNDKCDSGPAGWPGRSPPLLSRDVDADDGGLPSCKPPFAAAAAAAAAGTAVSHQRDKEICLGENLQLRRYSPANFVAF